VQWAFRGFNPHHRRISATIRCSPTSRRPGGSSGSRGLLGIGWLKSCAVDHAGRAERRQDPRESRRFSSVHVNQQRLHATSKNFQLDLVTPDDGHFEYYAVATNMTLGLPALFAFVCGRGAQEKTLAELNGEFGLDVVPPITTAPTAPGNSSACSPTTSPGAFSWRPRRGEAAHAQADPRLRVPQHAHAALPARRARRARDPHLSYFGSGLIVGRTITCHRLYGECKRLCRSRMPPAVERLPASLHRGARPGLLRHRRQSRRDAAPREW
jgi:hypothetical protein